MRFGTSRKLASRLIGPYSISKRVRKLAYHVGLPTELTGVHDAFHVSHLRKYLYKTTTLGEPNQLLHTATELIAHRAPPMSWSMELESFVTKKLGWSEYNGERT